MRQKPEEQMRVYVYRYGRMHQRSSGIRAAEETHQHVIQDFIKSLNPKLKTSLLTNLQRQVQAQNSRPCVFTCARSREENPDCRLFQG